jgi:phenylalanyl-tRNA synthetase beta chain
MGGQVSEVSGDTTRVLLEVANWNGVNILRTSRKLGLRSDASNRFEKQLHPDLAMRAQRVASKLMVELCGAKLVPGTIDEAAEIPERHRVTLRAGRAEALLGMEVPVESCTEYLERLDFEVNRDGDDIDAVVPVERHYDVTREADLVEEVGRIHGYAERLPSTLPGTSGSAGRLTREQKLRRRAEDVMRDLGFNGVVTLSLTDPGMAGRLRLSSSDPRGEAIGVSNPLSVDQSVLRTTLLGTLLDAARYNRAHGATSVAVFESGRAYLRDGDRGDSPQAGAYAGERPAPAFEPLRIAALATGTARSGDWRGEEAPADFYALKGVLEALAAQLGCPLEVEAASEPFLHPGRSAGVLLGGARAGWLGELHPLVCRAWDLEGAAGFEIDVAPLFAGSGHGLETYEDVSTYPAVEQDLAVVVPGEVTAAAVEAAVVEAGGDLLRSAELFDVYTGEQVGEGGKSLALRLEFRAPDRTLTDAEVSQRREAIKAALQEIGGSLRE